MNIEEAAGNLGKQLNNDSNYQAVAIRKEAKEDSLVVHTYDTPTGAELFLESYEGFRVVWKRMGLLVG